MAISGWFTKKDPEVLRRYNNILTIRLAKNISKKLEEFERYSGTTKSDVVGPNYNYVHKFKLLYDLKGELDKSAVLSRNVSAKNVPIKQLYATIYDAVYNKKRSSGYPYFKTLERFVVDGKGNGQGELPAIEHELINEMVAYREQVITDLKQLKKENIEKIDREFNITKTLASKSPSQRSFLPLLIGGILLLGTMMLYFFENEQAENTSHTEQSPS
ncbi:MAG TPA: hypothetical protein VEC16_03300 [Alphaproteobacteria bacterium]|nr:hypothetical protein [Alphaproteobacteria bacterium]